MLIDGFTVLAQILNFLILVAGLKYFLYQPILKAIKQRELRINEHLQEAAIQLENAQKEAQLYREKQAKLEQQKHLLLEQAQAEVIAEKKRLLAEAQQEVATVKSQWYKQLERNKQAELENLRQHLREKLVVITRQILKDLANTSLEDQMITVFQGRLGEFTWSSLANCQEAILIKTSFDLTSEQQHKLRSIIPKKIKFQIDEELICGIEILTQNYKIAWSIKHYLQEYEQAFIRS